MRRTYATPNLFLSTVNIKYSYDDIIIRIIVIAVITVIRAIIENIVINE